MELWMLVEAVRFQTGAGVQFRAREGSNMSRQSQMREEWHVPSQPSLDDLTLRQKDEDKEKTKQGEKEKSDWNSDRNEQDRQREQRSR
jgi:hypothetical protein